MMTMHLSHYPGAIAEAAQRVNELDSEIMAVQQLTDFKSRELVSL